MYWYCSYSSNTGATWKAVIVGRQYSTGNRCWAIESSNWPVVARPRHTQLISIRTNLLTSADWTGRFHWQLLTTFAPYRRFHYFAISSEAQPHESSFWIPPCKFHTHTVANPQYHSKKMFAFEIIPCSFVVRILAFSYTLLFQIRKHDRHQLFLLGC